MENSLYGLTDRELFAKQAIEAGKRQTSVEQEVCRLYDAYLAKGSEQDLSDLLAQTEKLGYGIVHARLTKIQGLSNMIEDAAQEILIQFYQLVSNDRKNGTRQDNIAYTIRALYKNRTVDVIRKYTRERTKLPTISIDDYNTDPNGKTRERINPSNAHGNIKPAPGQQTLHGRLLMLYLQAVLDYPNEPHKPIALCYGRVLYQIEMLLDPDEIDRAGMKKASKTSKDGAQNYKTIVDSIQSVQSPTTVTSMSWAMDKLQDQTLGALSAGAEASLQKNIEPSLHWGAQHRTHLEMPSACDTSVLWKDIVYTDHFTVKQTSDWATSIHRSAMNTALDAVYADSALLQDVLISCTPFRTAIKKYTAKKGAKKYVSPDER